MSKRYLICPKCPALVRVPLERLKDGPKCSKCKGSLVIDPVLSADGPSLELAVSTSDVPIIVDFWAPWCGPCRGFAPVFQHQAEQEPARALYLKVNTEDNPAVANRYGIQSIPTLIAFLGGKEFRRQSGAMNASQLHSWIAQIG